MYGVITKTSKAINAKRLKAVRIHTGSKWFSVKELCMGNWITVMEFTEPVEWTLLTDSGRKIYSGSWEPEETPSEEVAS